jgi:DNA-binding transcriptional LysR family regulator
MASPQLFIAAMFSAALLTHPPRRWRGREIVIDFGLTDIVAERLDAGVRFGETVASGMIAVRIAPDARMAVVGSPSYFAEHKPPKVPQDLTVHKCINLRLPTHGGVYAWEFEKAGREMNVRVDGQLVFGTATFFSPPRARASGSPI